MESKTTLKKKFAGARISTKKLQALEKMAKLKGYPSVAEMIRAIYDAALQEAKP